MYRRSNAAPFLSERTVYLLVFGVMSVVFFAGSMAIVYWISGRLQTLSPPVATSPIYTNYATGPTSYLKPASIAAMNKYIAEHPQPQNVQILKGMATGAIANYMVGQFAGGLKVDCTYCHNLAQGNFASDENLPVSVNQKVPNKTLARQMMLMSADLNKTWVSQLPASVGGKQVTCATCHNGVPANFNGDPRTGVLGNYPADQSPLPDDYMLPLQLAYPGVLTVTNEINPATGRVSPDLGKVQLNQYAMNHMTYSLGVGCTFCHNATYFPSNERAEKGYSIIMLNMARDIDQKYKGIMANKSPSCWMCHRQQYIPPGSANPGQVPAMLSYQPSQ